MSSSVWDTLVFADNKITIEIAAQGIAQCKVSATRVVVDAVLRRIGKSRRGGHKIANISRYCERILKRISPMDSAYFSGCSGGEKKLFFGKFF